VLEISMKNVIMGSVLAVVAATSLSAHAASVAVCTGGLAGNGPAATFATDGTSFVKVAFTPKCSANVILNSNDASATLFQVASASQKGKSTFNGSSAGGSVGVSAACAASPCTASEVGTALSAAPSS